MPYFTCGACHTRLYSAAAFADLAGRICPGCGAPLEPVAESTEAVGFRVTAARDSAADDSLSNTQKAIADPVDDPFARREAIFAQARLDADRWVDDGGSFGTEAVAEPMAVATPKWKP